MKEAHTEAAAALRNEQITRLRVEALELLLLGRTLFGRLRWLLTGR
jgi:hypothetical protein